MLLAPRMQFGTFILDNIPFQHGSSFCISGDTEAVLHVVVVTEIHERREVNMAVMFPSPLALCTGRN